MNLCDLKTIKGIMKTFGIEFRKEFGQNFLTNNFVVENIADECCFGQSRTILEIGPGIGPLTKELCERYENVIAYEIDKSLIPVLSYTLGSYDNITVINEDVMKADLHAVLDKYMDGGVSVCAASCGGVSERPTHAQKSKSGFTFAVMAAAASRL